MFGGLTFLRNGNMVCGVVRDSLCVRLGEAGAEAALAEEHTRPMDFTGKPLRTMVYVGPAGTRGEEELRGWVERAWRFTGTLAAK